MMKLKYLRHPIRTANAAKGMLAMRLNMWRFAVHGARRFRGDARYDLQNVTDGFASRIDDSQDDGELLERICAAYIKATEQQQFASEAFRATEWWEQVRRRSLGPVMRALRTRDIEALRKMYQNFFRDPCSAGLLGVPYGMSNAYFGRTIKDVHRSFYLSHALYRIDYWMKQTDNRFALRDLGGGEIGNPFGVLIDGTFVRVGADYAHYCAHRIGDLVDSEKATAVAEIGGGYGGMAYYLLRDKERVTYLNFDVPESIALSSYYLLKTFPHLRFLLFGEQKLTKEAIDRADGVLMPVFELAILPEESIDVTFSSHAMSDLSYGSMIEYFNRIARATQGAFLHIGNDQACKSISEIASRSNSLFRLAETRSSGWHSHKISGAGVGGAAGLASSTMSEQCYVRTAASRTSQQSPDRSREWNPAL
jgi:putative sugar O-methyltransferase